MGSQVSAPGQFISLAQGGGALHGIGETFSPDLQTGTGNFTGSARDSTGTQWIPAAAESRLQHRQR